MRLPVSTCGGDCQPWPSPVSPLRPFPPKPPEVYLLPLTPVFSEQVLRVPVPPNVAFELGKERSGLWQGFASQESPGLEAMIPESVFGGGSSGKHWNPWVGGDTDPR